MSIPNLTLIIITHFSPKEEYGQSKPPSNSLVSKTYNSIQNEFNQFEEIVNQKILVYNRPKILTHDSLSYDSNLESFSEQNNFYYLKTPNEGLRNALKLGTSLAKNDLVFFVEHDWEFVAQIDTNDLIRAMSKSHIKLISFNSSIINNPKHLDDLKNTEKIGCVTPKISFGNGSYITTKDYLEKLIEMSKPTLSFKFLLGASTMKNKIWTIGFFLRLIKIKLPSFANKLIPLHIFDSKYRYVWPYLNNMEFVLDSLYQIDIYLYGADVAHRNWGIYYFGEVGEGPYIEHQGR